MTEEIDRIENLLNEVGDFPSNEKTIKNQNAVEEQLATIGQELRESLKSLTLKSRSKMVRT